MKRILFLAIAGIILGQNGFCDERVTEPAFSSASVTPQASEQTEDVPQDIAPQDYEYNDIEDMDIPEIYRSLKSQPFATSTTLTPKKPSTPKMQPGRRIHCSA